MKTKLHHHNIYADGLGQSPAGFLVSGLVSVSPYKPRLVDCEFFYDVLDPTSSTILPPFLLQYLTFSLTTVLIPSIVPSIPEILSSISFILLVMLKSVVPVHLPRFSASRIPSVCVFFIAPISTFGF